MLGLYLLLFQREQPFSVFFDTMGAGGGESYFVTFLAASLSGLFLFYGFEACGDVAEEVSDPTRRIPRAMILTIVVGGVSGFLSYAGYVLAAPDLEAIVAGEDADPIPGILESSLGHVRVQGLPRHHRDGVHLLRAVAAGRRQPAALLLRPRPDAPRQRVAGPPAGPARGADQRAGRGRPSSRCSSACSSSGGPTAWPG